MLFTKPEAAHEGREGIAKETENPLAPLGCCESHVGRRPRARGRARLHNHSRLHNLYPDFFTRRSWPVISSGCGIPNIPSMVGDRSCRAPSARNVNCLGSSETAMSGTGFVVWAVWGPPVAGSIIISALP